MTGAKSPSCESEDVPWLSAGGRRRGNDGAQIVNVDRSGPVVAGVASEGDALHFAERRRLIRREGEFQGDPLIGHVLETIGSAADLAIFADDSKAQLVPVTRWRIAALRD